MKKSILDPTFHYTPSVETDIRKTFARERKRLAKEKAAARSCVPPVNVAQLPTTTRRKAS